jgi:hypothetical protein
MRFYEFDLPVPKHTNDLVDKGASAAKSAAKKTISGTKGALGMAGKGLAKVSGMLFKHFDPAMQDLYRDGEPNPSQKQSSNEGQQRFKNALGKAMNKTLLGSEDENNLKIGLSQAYSADMKTEEFRAALEKLINKDPLSGKEILLLKKVYSKLS